MELFPLLIHPYVSQHFKLSIPYQYYIRVSAIENLSQSLLHGEKAMWLSILNEETDLFSNPHNAKKQVKQSHTDIQSLLTMQFLYCTNTTLTGPGFNAMPGGATAKRRT